MAKNKKKKVKTRLPKGTVLFLRTHGGAHGSQKGKRGYDKNDRRKNKIRSHDIKSKSRDLFFVKKGPA